MTDHLWLVGVTVGVFLLSVGVLTTGHWLDQWIRERRRE